MTTLLASIAAFTVPMVLLISVAEHLSRPTALVRALATHRVLPAAPLIAATVVTAEALLGGAVLLGLFHPDGSRLLTAALAGSAALFTLYSGYALLVTASGRNVPCGCSRIELPMSGWVVIRALTLVALALTGAVLGDDVLRPGDGPLSSAADGAPAVVLIAAVTFAALLWHLPAAMYDPTRPVTPAVIGPRQEGGSG